MPYIMVDDELIEVSEESLHRGPPDEKMVRFERNILLSETDWWAVADRTMTQAEIDYRQALRDLPQNPNWPDLSPADWPTKP